MFVQSNYKYAITYSDGTGAVTHPKWSLDLSSGDNLIKSIKYSGHRFEIYKYSPDYKLMHVVEDSSKKRRLYDPHYSLDLTSLKNSVASNTYYSANNHGWSSLPPQQPPLPQEIQTYVQNLPNVFTTTSSKEMSNFVHNMISVLDKHINMYRSINVYGATYTPEWLPKPGVSSLKIANGYKKETLIHQGCWISFATVCIYKDKDGNLVHNMSTPYKNIVNGNVITSNRKGTIPNGCVLYIQPLIAFDTEDEFINWFGEPNYNDIMITLLTRGC